MPLILANLIYYLLILYNPKDTLSWDPVLLTSQFWICSIFN